jgi:hypothetical protein
MQKKNPSGQKPKIVVERRRKPTGGEASQPRATAPQRKTPRPQSEQPYTPSTSGADYSGSSGGFSSSQGSYSSGQGGIPLGSLLPLLKRLPWWAVLCLVVAFIGFIVLAGGGGGLLGGDTSEDTSTYVEPTQPEQVVLPEATPTRRPTAVTVAGGAGDQTWLIMLYQDADDKVLEQDIFVDLNEAERVGSNEQVQIVAQVDRFSAGFTGDGDWTTTKRFYITQDDDLKRINSPVVSDLGEVNMSDATSLVDFVTWAVSSYPAHKYVLILSDHGMGWPGGWSDSAPKRSDSSNALAERIGDQIYLDELDRALSEIRNQTGIGRFELVGMDACLMGHLEVFTMLSAHANFAVASQETEPALGWAYTGFLSDLQADPGMDGGTLGQLIVESYIEEDQRLVDPAARAEYLKQGSPLSGLFSFLGASSADQIAQQLEASITLSAVDLSQISNVNSRVNELAYVLQNISQNKVAQARNYAQSFTSVFGKDVPASYVDLGNLAALLKQESGNSGVSLAVDEVLSAIEQAVVTEKHGSKKPGATGLSVFFPNQQLYKNNAVGAKTYAQIAANFAAQSLWDDFLAFHYSGRSFELTDAQVVTVEPDESTRTPGAGQISISQLTLSSSEASPGNPLVISADVSGTNIGHIKLFVGYYDEGSNSIFVSDMDYLESADTREIDGVYYPVWPDGDFQLEFSWDPIIFAINDGTTSVPALFTPESYGRTFEEAVYTVDGYYTYIDDGQTVYARLYFSNGVLTSVFGFTGENGTGAPHEITPTQGDQFTVLETWMDLNQNGEVTETVYQQGSTLTFGEFMFTWESLYAAEGEYIVGFVVEDLDGNATQALAPVTVR